jgi:phosphotransferase system  glucose/maltose/N-acetylglucosamine-specific IIC component
MRLRYIEPIRLKVLMMMFFGTGIMGMVMGLLVAPPSMTMILTFMGVVNIGLAAFFTFTFLTQTRKEPDKRKKKRKQD